MDSVVPLSIRINASTATTQKPIAQRLQRGAVLGRSQNKLARSSTQQAHTRLSTKGWIKRVFKRKKKKGLDDKDQAELLPKSATGNEPPPEKAPRTPVTVSEPEIRPLNSVDPVDEEDHVAQRSQKKPMKHVRERHEYSARSAGLDSSLIPDSPLTDHEFIYFHSSMTLVPTKEHQPPPGFCDGTIPHTYSIVADGPQLKEENNNTEVKNHNSPGGQETDAKQYCATKNESSSVADSNGSLDNPRSPSEELQSARNRELLSTSDPQNITPISKPHISQPLPYVEHCKVQSSQSTSIISWVLQNVKVLARPRLQLGLRRIEWTCVSFRNLCLFWAC
jgi:hypothetical protein